MVYSDKYHIEWATPTADCLLRIQQDGYSGSITQLTPGTDAFELTWGQQNRQDLTSPLRISTARIRFIGDSDGELVQEIFDGSDTEWRVLFERDLGSGHQLEWQGFIATDLWRDDPHLDSDTVEVEALDGLALLENRDFDDFAGGDLYGAARSVLRGLHELNVAANMEWYPYREGNQLSHSQLPLYYLEADLKAFNELEPIEGEKGFEIVSKSSDRRALEAILERFGMELFQSRGEWQMRQRHRIHPDGSIKMWPDESAVVNNNYEMRDLNRTLGALHPRNRPRGLVQRLRTAESVHKYENLGDLIVNGSFEDPLSKWTTSGNASRVQYDNVGNLPGGTQEDGHLIELDTSGKNNPASVRQNIAAIDHYAGPRGAYQFEWDVTTFTNNADTPRFQFKVKRDDGEDATLNTAEMLVYAPADPADEGKLHIEPIFNAASPADSSVVQIPAGARLPVVVGEDSGLIEGYITLSQPAYGGDSVLVGKISHEISKFAFGEGTRVRVWYWDVGADSYLGFRDELPNWPGSDLGVMPSLGQEATQKLVVPQHDPDGNPIVGELSVELGIEQGHDPHWIDHVSTRIAVAGDPVAETSYTALDDQSGRGIEITQLLGDGPRPGHPRALQLDGVDLTQDWQEGHYSSGESRSGQLLEELTAEAAMRQQRDTLQRRTHTVELRNEEIWPQHVFTIEGELYTVSYLTRTFGTNGDVAEAELTRLKDSGTSGLERIFQMEASGSGGAAAGGGGRVIGGGGGGGGGASNWQQITGKPDGLFADGGESDGYSATKPITNDDIASALDHSSPGLAEGILTSIRDSPTDTALVTEAAVSTAVSDATISVDLDGDGTREIDPLQDISVNNDANNVFSKDPAEGQMQVDVGAKWPNAEQVDGYDAEDFAIPSQDETISGEWDFTSDTDFSAEVRHPDWATGLSHWGIEPDGSADFRLVETDELRAEAFTADVTQSLAGSDVLTKSAADLASGFTVPDPADGFVTDALHIENVGEVGAQAAFEDGDTIRLRIVDRSGGGLDVIDVWGTAQNYTDNGDGTQSWDFQTADGTQSSAYGRTINKGSRVLDYGTEGDPIIERSVTDIKSPFDRTVRWFDDDGDGVPDRYEVDTQTGRIDGVPDVSTTDPGFFGSTIRLTDDILAGDLTKQDNYLEYDNSGLVVDGTVFMRNGVVEESVTIGGTGVWPSQLPGDLISLWSGHDERDKISDRRPLGRGNDLPEQEVFPAEEGRIAVNAGFADYIRVDRDGAHGNGSLFVGSDQMNNMVGDGGFESGSDTGGGRSLSTNATFRATGSTSVIQTDEAHSGDYALEMVKDYDPDGSTPGETTNEAQWDITVPSGTDFISGSIKVKPMDLSGIDNLEINVRGKTHQFDANEGEWQYFSFTTSVSSTGSQTVTVRWPGSEDNVGRLLIDEFCYYPQNATNIGVPDRMPFDSGEQGSPNSLRYPADLDGDFTVGAHIREWTGDSGADGLFLEGPEPSDYIGVGKASVQWSISTGLGANKNEDLGQFPEADDEYKVYWLFITREADTISMKAFLSDGSVLEMSLSDPDISSIDLEELGVGGSAYAAFYDHVLVADTAYSTADCERVVNSPAPVAPGGVGINDPAPGGGVTIRSDSEPTERPDGTALQKGDVWIDTDDGDKPHSWNGNDWIATYTEIDGGNLETGTVTADEIDTTDLFAENITLNNGGSIESSNFSTGSSGFRIESDGTAEFQSGTFRGTVEAESGSITGNLTIGDGNGNGELTNPSGDFTIDEDGLTLGFGANISSELTFNDSSGDTGAFMRTSDNTLNNSFFIGTTPGMNLEISSQEQFIIASVDRFRMDVPYIDLNIRTSDPSSPPKDYARIYTKDEGNVGEDPVLFRMQPDGQTERLDIE